MPDAAPVITTGRPVILGSRDGIAAPGRLGSPAAAGVAVDEVDEKRPRSRWQVMAKAGDGFQAGTADRARRGRSARRVDHAVTIAVDHQRRGGDRPQLPGPVTGAE